MPNQYTKFKEASTNLRTREFRWREYGRKGKGSSPGSNEYTTSEPEKTSRQRLKTLHSTLKSTNDRSFHEGHEPEFECCDAIVKRLPGEGLRIDPFKAYPVKPTHPELEVLDYCELYAETPTLYTNKRSLACLVSFEPESTLCLRSETDLGATR